MSLKLKFAGIGDGNCPFIEAEHACRTVASDVNAASLKEAHSANRSEEQRTARRLNMMGNENDRRWRRPVSTILTRFVEFAWPWLIKHSPNGSFSDQNRRKPSSYDTITTSLESKESFVGSKV